MNTKNRGKEEKKGKSALTKLTLIIHTYLKKLEALGINCYDVNVALDVLKTILFLM